MKIIVEEVVNGEKVLVPEVFLASVRAEDLTNDGALIVGGDVAIYSKENIENIGTIRADGTVELKGENINNLGGRIDGENVNLDADKNITNKGGNIRARVDTILNGENVINEANVKESQYKGLDQKTVGNAGSIRAGQNLSINVEKDIVNKGSVLVADNNLDLNAGRNVDIVTVANEKHVGVVCPGSSAEIHSVENQQSVMTGGNVNINAGSDVNIQGGLIAADKDTAVKAGGNVNINAVKDSYSEETRVGSRGGSYYNHNKQVDEAVKGTTIAAKNDISIASGKDINIKGSNVASEAGKADLIAENNINIANATEHHERLHEEHNKVSGFLSSKTTDIYDYSKQNTVVGSNVSAGEIAISSKEDTNITGSNVVADNDVSVKTGGSMNIGSAEQTSESEYIKSVKKSGVFAGGGLGFTIGKEKQKDQYANQNTEQVGSTVGSVKGNVNLDADKAANVKGSSVVAGKDVTLNTMEKSILAILKTIAKRKICVIVVLVIVCVILGNQFMKSADEQELRNEAINIIYKSGFSTVIYDMHRDSHYWYTVQVPTSQSCRLINYYNSSLQNKGWIEDRGSYSKDGKIFLKTKNNVKTSVVLKIVKKSDEQTLWRIDVNSWN